MSNQKMQQRAFGIMVEDLIDDLVESFNGFELDHKWRSETIKRLVLARDKPEKFMEEESAKPKPNFAAWPWRKIGKDGNE